MQNEYDLLVKQSVVLESKESFVKLLNEVSTLIQNYKIVDAEDKSIVLDKMKDVLVQVIDLMSSLGYTYQPDSMAFDDEQSFINQLDEYKNQISSFLNDYEEKNFEAFNVTTRQIEMLVEFCRTNTMKEGEILTDL